MSSTDVKAFYKEFDKDAARMQKEIPDVLKGFGGLFQATMKDGALPVKQKELIAVAIALAVRCEPCVYLHVKKCLAAGATAEEIVEAASICIMMQGGPAYTHMPTILKAIDACQDNGDIAGSDSGRPCE